MYKFGYSQIRTIQYVKNIYNIYICIFLSLHIELNITENIYLVYHIYHIKVKTFT